jgi:hypothetical protein
MLILCSLEGDNSSALTYTKTKETPQRYQAAWFHKSFIINCLKFFDPMYHGDFVANLFYNGLAKERNPASLQVQIKNIPIK